MYNGGYAADRFSPLQQITPANVKSLVQVGHYQLPETTSFQAGPLVIGDTMFVTTATSTYALDPRTGTMRWVQKYTPKTMGLNTPVRERPMIRGDSIEALRTRTFSLWTPRPAR